MPANKPQIDVLARSPAIAYFSMEIALDDAIPTYAGGLGVLAGDTIRSAADLGVPMVAVSLLYRKGYFYQRLDDVGVQKEEPVSWAVDDYLDELGHQVTVTMEGREVQIRAWRYLVTGLSGSTVPVLLLDTDLPRNVPADRELSHYLYGGNSSYRLRQEVVLGIGGIRMLRALGYDALQRYHMNEGHAAILTLELLNEELAKTGRTSIKGHDIEAVRRRCVFTTHTPVPAGQDQFPLDLVYRVLEPSQHFVDMKDEASINVLEKVLQGNVSGSSFLELARPGTRLNMTYLALNLSRYVNGVAKKHGETSRMLFADYRIEAITNGVHAASWVGPSMAELLERYISGWKADNFSLRYAISVPNAELLAAHRKAKEALLQFVNRATKLGMDADAFTIGFARRATAYKRADLLFAELERLRRIAREKGPIQIVYAGKAHPDDRSGKEIIQSVFRAMTALQDAVKIAYLPNYDLAMAKALVAGVDLWLNTPQPPSEASGTSGMKAALNGVPSLSVLDGWWIEGHIEGVTGWAIDNGDSRTAATSLYDKLENVIVPTFYGDPQSYVDVMRQAIALNGSYFNTQRMIQQYVLNAYF